MALQLEDLVALDAPMPNATGTPLLIELDHIDEDPEQPRREFDAEALQALADTVRERGVRQPISVRPGLQPNRWVLNFGARRLRAARLAGLLQIPAFVDTTADRYDQVIENEQREGLKPLELAMFVQKRLGLGESQSEIARKLGKSRQWVAQATALIEAPDWLLQTYREGRCRGLNELSELRRLHAEHPQDVEEWVAQQVSVTRDRLQDLRRSFEVRTSAPDDAPDHPEPAPAERPPVMSDEQPAEREAIALMSSRPQQAAVVPPQQVDVQVSPPTSVIDLAVHVEVDGQDGILIVTVAPAEAGYMYVVPSAGGPRRSVPVSSIQLRGFVPSRACQSD